MADGSAALNSAQREAVDHDGGPLIVLAGPGTGKTRVIIHRIARIIEGGAEPESVVAVTFTIKAAAQLRERLAELVSPAVADRVNAHTFHGFGFRLLARFGDMIGLSARRTLIDSVQRRSLIRAIIRRLDLYTPEKPTGRDAVIPDAEAHLRALRQSAILPETAAKFTADWGKRLARGPDPLFAEALEAERARHARFADHVRLYEAYQRECLEKGFFDFDDLLLQPIRLLKESAAAAAICRDEFRHVVVDEFQDVDPAEIELLRVLCPPSPRPPDLCVVGDDDQSIYMFRGADDRAFARFRSIWTDAAQVRLSLNYRSERPIVTVANAVIGAADLRFDPEKTIELPPGKRPPAPGAGVECVSLDEDAQTGEAIAAMILTDRLDHPERPWSSYAVLCRTLAAVDSLAAALEIEGIPVRRSRGVAGAHDDGVRDVLAWMEVLSDPGAFGATRRLLTRPPCQVDPRSAEAWVIGYAAHASRVRAGDETAGGPLSMVEWVRARHAAEPGVRRFLALHDELRRIAAESPADGAAFEIVRLAGVAHADLLPARERARRVARVAELLRLVRDRMPALDPPGDLASFWAYYRALDEGERELRAEEEDKLDTAAPADEEDAVAVFTAHKCKGLEFDTVFVARVSPGLGFPQTRKKDDLELPEGLLDTAGDDRPLAERRLSEERRLFYVACTRAIRRLVLLAKGLKNPSRSTHYFQEVVSVCRATVVPRTAREIFAAASERGVRTTGLGAIHDAGGAAARSGAERRALLARARQDVRLTAAMALESMDAPDAAPEAIDRAGASLRDAAARLAILSHLSTHGEGPAWVDGGDLGAYAKDMAARLGAPGGDDRGLVFRRLTPPLALSYSWINDYERCPRCLYVKRVLQYPDPPGPQMALGLVAHAALERFYGARLAAQAESRPTPGPDDLRKLGRRAYFESLRPGARADEAQIEMVLAMLDLTLDRLHSERDEIEETEVPFKFPYHCGGAAHTFSGKVDRLDRWPEGGHRIIDYKTGKERDELIDPQPDDLQLGIYALFLRHRQQIDLADRATPASGVAEYWHLPTGQRGRIDLARIDYDAIRRRIDAAIEGMLEGRFPRGERCSGVCEVLGPEGER